MEGPFSSKSRHSELASSATKSRKSASSVSSSVSNARAKISARKAGLLAKANMLKKMQSLEQEELKLKQDLNLEAKLAQADAEEHALMEEEEGNVGGVVNDEPPLPLNAYVSSWMEKCDEKVDPHPIETQ